MKTANGQQSGADDILTTGILNAIHSNKQHASRGCYSSERTYTMHNRKFAALFAASITLAYTATSLAQAPRENAFHPQLVSADVAFDTHNEDKDHDTRLDVAVDAGGRRIASRDGIYGRFPDNTHNGPFALRVMGLVNRQQAEHGVLHLEIRPNGHDTWRFSPILTLRFQDGTTRTYRGGRMELSQDRRHGTMNF